MHLPATATQVALPSLPRIRMLAAVQLLLAKLLAFLCANQLGVTDIVKRDITTHVSEKTLMPFATTYLCESGFLISDKHENKIQAQTVWKTI